MAKDEFVTTIPCDCGSPNAKWHDVFMGGQEPSLQRAYRCENCQSIESAIAFLRSDHVQRNKHRLGVLGAQDIDGALRALTEAQ